MILIHIDPYCWFAKPHTVFDPDHVHACMSVSWFAILCTLSVHIGDFGRRDFVARFQLHKSHHGVRFSLGQLVMVDKMNMLGQG